MEKIIPSLGFLSSDSEVPLLEARTVKFRHFREHLKLTTLGPSPTGDTFP